MRRDHTSVQSNNSCFIAGMLNCLVKSMTKETDYQKERLAQILKEECASRWKSASGNGLVTGIVCATDCENCHSDWAEKQAEFLLSRGVIVLPVPEGSPIYCDGIHFAPHCAGDIHEIKGWYYDLAIKKDFRSEADYWFDIGDYNRTWFSSSEDARKRIFNNNYKPNNRKD